MKKPVALMLAVSLIVFFAFGASAESDPHNGLSHLLSVPGEPYSASEWKAISDDIKDETQAVLHAATFYIHPDGKTDIDLRFIGSDMKAEPPCDAKDVMTAEKDDESGYDYLLYLPRDYKTSEHDWPLIVSLHGLTMHGNDPMALAKDGLPLYLRTRSDFPMVMVAPLCGEDSHWVEDRQGNEDMHEIDRLVVFVRNMTEKYKIDPKRVYVTGYSMGGRAAWKLACAIPDVFAAVVPICGRADAYDLEKLKDVPVWVFHGVEDDTVPLEYENNTIRRFIEMKHPNFHVTIFPELKHDSWNDAYRMPDLWEFIRMSVHK